MICFLFNALLASYFVKVKVIFIQVILRHVL